MKKLAVGIFSLLLVVMVAMPLGAQEVTCDDIAFDQQAMISYPMVREACLDIVEHEGSRYAHLVARVRQAGPPSMLLVFKHRDGTWGPATRVTPPPNFKASLGGQVVNAVDVPAGSEMGIYLPEGRWEIAMSDADAMVVEEATFAPIEFEVVEMELTEEVDAEAPPLAVDEAPAEAAYEAEEPADQEAAAADDYEDDAESDSEWLWILGLAGAFIIVWFLLRRKKASREG